VKRRGLACRKSIGVRGYILMGEQSVTCWMTREGDVVAVEALQHRKKASGGGGGGGG
jgi:hypothetical protein